MGKKVDDKQQLVEEQRRQAVSNYKSATSYNILSEAQAIGVLLKSIVAEGKYDNIMKCLDRLSLPVGYVLNVKLPESNGYGDYSTLYVKKPCGDVIKDVLSILSVEDSAIGALQVYLLYEVWHYLPLYWHANYCHRTYVYSKEELSEIDTKTNLCKYNVTPSVSKNGEKYYVSTCFWSEFEGLVRELVEIEIKEGKIISIFKVKQQVLHKDDRGVCICY